MVSLSFGSCFNLRSKSLTKGILLFKKMYQLPFMAGNLNARLVPSFDIVIYFSKRRPHHNRDKRRTTVTTTTATANKRKTTHHCLENRIKEEVK